MEAAELLMRPKEILRPAGEPARPDWRAGCGRPTAPGCPAERHPDTPGEAKALLRALGADSRPYTLRAFRDVLKPSGRRDPSGGQAPSLRVPWPRLREGW